MRARAVLAASSPASRQAPSSPQRTVIAADLSTLDEELELLRRFTEEAAPVPEVSLDARLQVHGRFRAEFLSICGRGEHLQAAMPEEGKPHRLTSLVMHLWVSFVMLREAFLTEMVLLPPTMEKACLSMVISAECQAAACRVIGRLLHARTPNIERQLCAACMRAESLSHELRTAEIFGTSLYEKSKAEKKKRDQARIPAGTELETEYDEYMAPLVAVRKQAARALEELQKTFPTKGTFSPKKPGRPGKPVTDGTTYAPDMEVEDSHFEFVAVAGKADSSLGFGTTSMPPEPVFVHRLETGGWAEKHGVRPHDELYMVDNDHVEDLTAQELVVALRRRPVRLTFAREAETRRAGVGDALITGKHDDDHKHAIFKAPLEAVDRNGEPINDDVGHREWLDTVADWFEGVVDSARNMIEVADLDLYSFRPFLNARDEDDIGMVVGLTDTRQKIGVEGSHTDLKGCRALSALREQNADFIDRSDERILAALELSGGGGWIYEGAGKQTAEVFKKALKRNPTQWPTYPGEQLNSLASSVRREVQGAFLSV